MKELSRILVGHDLKSGGEAALKSAATIAQSFGAAIRVVHVVEPLEPYQRLSHPLTPPYPIDEIVRRTGEKLRALVAAPELAGLDADYEVRTGKPFFELILAQRGWLANLVVMGGPSQPEEPISSSTSDRLVRKGAVPVLVAKTPLRSAARTFLMATDFSAPAREAAEAALRPRTISSPSGRPFSPVCRWTESSGTRCPWKAMWHRPLSAAPRKSTRI
jgi:nucleotide-binding universal stress UspA family protein